MKGQAAEEDVANLLIRLILGFPEEAHVLDQPGLDVLVVHELTEYVEFLPQELVGEIHLLVDQENDFMSRVRRPLGCSEPLGENGSMTQNHPSISYGL